VRESTIGIVQCCIDKIDSDNKNVNITKTIGSGASIGGGLLTLGSILLASATGRLSLWGLLGIGVGIGGAATNIGSEITLG